MMNSLFTQKLLKLVFENSLQKKKLLSASELYLTSSIKILEKDADAILFDIDNEFINIVYQNNRIVCYKNNRICSIDEKVIACALYYKREYYIKNETTFNMTDLQLNSYYYNSYFISNIYYEEYQYRFNFYYGVIDELYRLNMHEYCIKVMVEMFSVLDNKFTYDSKYQDISKQNLYRIIRDKSNLLYEKPQEIIDSFDSNLYPITTLGKFIYIAAINKPNILSNTNIKILYEYVFENYLNILKNTQLFRDLKKQSEIILWYNHEKDDYYMEQNIYQYEVMNCYVEYLYDKSLFTNIYELFKDYKFSIINNETINRIIYAFYAIQKYEEAIKLFKTIKNINFDMFLTYKKDLPILFNQKYIDLLIENIIETCNEDEALKIIEYENIQGYQIIIAAKKDFNSVDIKFNEYLGKYDKELIKIYQKEITNDLLKTRGYHYGIPEYIMEKLEKLKKVKNGRYYILEIINYVNERTYLSFNDELVSYCKSLGV